MIAELDGSNTIVRRFAWGLDVSGSLQGAGGIGGLLVIDAGTQYHPLYDASHNVIGLYNSSGSLQAAYAYDAFGNLQTSAGTYAASNPFRSATKYTDSETGFVYYGMRYFSPTLGRFINRDPIEEGGGLNLYLFCMNDGVNRYDYLGMNAFTDWAVAILNSISSFLGNMSGDVLVLDRMIVTPGENDSNVSKPSDDSPGYLSMVASNRAVTDYQNENTMDESAPNSGVSNYGGQANGVKFAPDAEKGPIIQTVAYLSQSKTFREAWKRVVDSSTPVRVGTLRFDPKSSAAYGQSYPQGSRIVMWFDPGGAAVTADGRTLYPAQVFAHEVYRKRRSECLVVTGTPIV